MKTINKKYKTRRTIAIVASVTTLLMLIIYSCNKLDLQPLDRVTSSTYYQTPADFDGAIFSTYASIQDLWGTSTENLGERGEFWKITLGATDDVTINGKAGDAGDLPIAKDLDNLLFRAADVPWAAVYTQIYEGINRANIVIEAADNGTNSLTDEQKTQYVAEAKFLRGFFHFLAMEMWGTPPLLTEVKTDINNLAQGNATQEDLYAAILSDFTDAYQGLPASWDASNLGRATKWAARAMEGKVNVWKKDWAAAITAFEDVRASGAYSLFPTYLDAFDFTKENGVESIFEVQYGGPFSDDNLWVFDDTHSENFKASQGTGRVWYWDASGDAGAPGGGLGWYSPTQNLIDEFEANDPRLSACVYRAGDIYYYDGGTKPFDTVWSSTHYGIKKYFGERNGASSQYAPNGQAGFNNERWFRYADMLLLYAEALINSNRAAEGMAVINNEIRKRVNMGNSPIADPMKALMHERRVEMAFEPHRIFDIMRWGIGNQVFGAAWKSTYNVFPFPQSEVDRSGGLLKQNDGY